MTYKSKMKRVIKSNSIQFDSVLMWSPMGRQDPLRYGFGIWPVSA